MNRAFFIVFTILLLTGCATTKTRKAYNTPFVDIVETIELSSNLSRDDVLLVMGDPLYVEFGDSKTGQIFWVYEVRSKEVKSEITFNGERILNKTNKIHRPSAPVHKLKLEFRDDKLYRWSPITSTENDKEAKDVLESEDEISETSAKEDNKKVVPPKKSKFKSFFFQPEIARYSITSGSEGRGKIKAFYFGSDFGFILNSGSKIGIEFLFSLGDGRNNGFSIMGFHQRILSEAQKLTMIMSAGIAIHEKFSDRGEEHDGYNYLWTIGVGKISLGKKMIIGGMNIHPQFDIIAGDGSFVGFSLGVEL